MTRIMIELDDEAATAALGARLAAVLKNGDILLLSGDLGAGKSTLARGLIEALTGAAEAPSPTFTFVETYDAPGFTLRHFDLYRLETPEEVWELGFEDALSDGAALVEWPERLGALIPADGLAIRLNIDGARRIAVMEPGETWAPRLAAAGIA